MFDRSNHRPRWSVFSLALIAFMVLSIGVACGAEDDDDDDDSGGSAATTAGGSTGGTLATSSTDDGTPAGDTGDMGAIGACFMLGMSSDVVEELRAGDSTSAEEMFRGCLGDSLPEGLVDQLDPIIEQAATCGEAAAQDLSEDEVASLEEGDEAVAEDLANETLACVSDELGVDLS